MQAGGRRPRLRGREWAAGPTGLSWRSRRFIVGAAMLASWCSSSMTRSTIASWARRISQVTRREIFDYLRTEGGPWWGRLSEVAFLARLYNLEALPSTDRRFKTADSEYPSTPSGQLRLDDDWVFDDPRLRLASGPDEVLLGFLAQIVHPVVQPDTGRAAEIVSALNDLLAPDGWMLKRHAQMSGRPVFAAARTGTGDMAAVSFAHEAAARIDAEHISQQVTRMEGAVDTTSLLQGRTAWSTHEVLQYSA